MLHMIFLFYISIGHERKSINVRVARYSQGCNQKKFIRKRGQRWEIAIFNNNNNNTHTKRGPVKMNETTWNQDDGSGESRKTIPKWRCCSRYYHGRVGSWRRQSKERRQPINRRRHSRRKEKKRPGWKGIPRPSAALIYTSTRVYCSFFSPLLSLP